MLSSEQILEHAAHDGSIDIGEWPAVLETLLKKLHDIVYNDFPLPSIILPEPLPPTIDPEVVASTPPTGPTSDPELKDVDELPDANENEPPPNSQSSTKENEEPADIAAARRPLPSQQSNITRQSLQPPDRVETQSGTLPPDLLSLYSTSRHVLENDFAHSPPYTIQRLAELVLYPKQHYRFLPAFLRALDRIVSVSSPISDFPLPTLHTTPNGGFLTNGDSTMVNGIPDAQGLGSDESLGGALLTPIPWLRNNTLGATAPPTQGEGELHSESTETIDGPNGAGSIETVTVTVNGVPSATSIAHTSPSSPTLSDQSDASSPSSNNGGPTEAQLREQGGVTQGELLRQEQEAGVIPVTQMPPRRSLLAASAAAVGREDQRALASAPGPAELGEERAPEDIPHARGPEEIGMEDMGPQHHNLGGNLDMEAAVGRERSKSPQPPVMPSSPDPVLADKAVLGDGDDDAGAPGKDPADVEKEVEKLKEAMEVEKEEEARDADGDVVVADADGRDVNEKEGMEVTGDLGGPDAVDATGL